MLFLEFTRSNYNGVVSVYIAGYIEEPTSYGPVEHYFTTSDYSEPYDPDALDFIEMSYSKNDFDYDCLTPNTEHNIATIYIARKEEVSFVVNYSTPLTNGSVPIKLTKDEMEAIDVGSTQLIGTYEVSTERGGKIYNDNLTIKIKRTSTEFTIIGTLGAATEEYTCGFTDESFIMPNGTIPYKTLSITYNVFSYNEAM